MWRVEHLTDLVRLRRTDHRKHRDLGLIGWEGEIVSSVHHQHRLLQSRSKVGLVSTFNDGSKKESAIEKDYGVEAILQRCEDQAYALGRACCPPESGAQRD